MKPVWVIDDDRSIRWVFEKALTRENIAFRTFSSADEALGVLAGSLPIGLARIFGRLPGVNDGMVCLEETAVEGMAGRVVLAVGHSQMLVSARVADEVAAFLSHGKFIARHG